MIENLPKPAMDDHHLAFCAAKPHPAGMITSPQIRAARALLGWSAERLAKEAGISYPTIQRAEAGNGVPSMRAPNLFAIQTALERAGVIFIDAGKNEDGGPGVRLR